MTDNMQRARELLAAECRAEKMGPVATAIEQGMHVSGFADIALRAIEAALRLSAPPDRVTDEMVDRWCMYAYADMGWPQDFSDEALVSNREWVRNGLEVALAQPHPGEDRS